MWGNANPISSRTIEAIKDFLEQCCRKNLVAVFNFCDSFNSILIDSFRRFCHQPDAVAKAPLILEALHAHGILDTIIHGNNKHGHRSVMQLSAKRCDDLLETVSDMVEKIPREIVLKQIAERRSDLSTESTTVETPFVIAAFLITLMGVLVYGAMTYKNRVDPTPPPPELPAWVTETENTTPAQNTEEGPSMRMR